MALVSEGNDVYVRCFFGSGGGGGGGGSGGGSRDARTSRRTQGARKRAERVTNPVNEPQKHFHSVYHWSNEDSMDKVVLLAESAAAVAVAGGGTQSRRTQGAGKTAARVTNPVNEPQKHLNFVDHTGVTRTRWKKKETAGECDQTCGRLLLVLRGLSWDSRGK